MKFKPFFFVSVGTFTKREYEKSPQRKSTTATTTSKEDDETIKNQKSS